MKKAGSIVAAMAIAVAGFGIGLCDYRPPTTDFLVGEVKFFYQHADDPATPAVDLSAGHLSFDARRLHDSLMEGFTIEGKGQARFAELRLVRAEISADATLRRYLADPLSLFVFGGGGVALDTAFLQPRAEARAGLGYGRFYDVTPLARAFEIEEQLLTRALLPAPLADAALLDVAAAIGQRVEDDALAERVASVASLIERAAGRRLDPATVLMIEQTIAAPRRARYCGWTVQAGLAYELMDPRGEPRDLLLSLALDAAIAPGRHSQLLFRARISGPYWITEQYTLSLNAAFDVQLDNAISFSAQYNLFQDKPLGQLPAGRQSVSFQLEISLGMVGVTLQMEFSKLAEAPAWRQSFIIAATAHLW